MESILFQIEYRIEDITLELPGVIDLHLRSQQHPPVSGMVPGKFQNLPSSVLEIERSIKIIGAIPLTPLGVTDLIFRNEEHPPMPRKGP